MDVNINIVNANYYMDMRLIKSIAHVAILCVAAVWLPSCGGGVSHSSAPAPLMVDVQVVAGEESLSVHSYGGELEDGRQVSVMAHAAGTVSRLLVRNNQRVDSGQVLLILDDTRQRSSLASAQAALAQTEDGYERVRKMYDGGGVAEVKLVEVQTQLSQAQALVAVAENELALRSVCSPQRGTVSGMDLQEGQTVAPGLSLMRIVGSGGMAVRFSVPEIDVGHLSVGCRGRVTVPALQERTFEGRVSDVDLVADPLSRSYSVRMAIDRPVSDMLPGMVCRVQVDADRVQGVLLPSDCLHQMVDGPAVWVVREGKAERRRVDEVRYHRSGVVVGRGLEAGDSVVTAGFQKMYNGAPLCIRSAK